MFLKLYHKVSGKSAPVKEVTKRREKEKLKPWVKKGIRKFIKIRYQLCKQFTKPKTNETWKIKKLLLKITAST